VRQALIGGVAAGFCHRSSAVRQHRSQHFDTPDDDETLVRRLIDGHN
jgi:hypothetical protein